MGPLTKSLLAAHSIPLDPQIPLHSIQKFLPDPFLPDPFLSPRHGTDNTFSVPRIKGPIPAPAVLRKKTRNLRKLRASDVWRSGSIDQQVEEMDEWFPDFPDVANASMLGMKGTMLGGDVFGGDEMDIDGDAFQDAFQQDVPNSTLSGCCPASNIGRLSCLPGELRNRIYRLSLVNSPEETIKVTLEAGICSHAACAHVKAPANLPGIASACKQLRWEVAPIFFAENVAGIEFDDGTVQQCCVGNYMRSLGSFVDLVSKFSFLLKRPIWRTDEFVRYAVYRFTITSPKKAECGEFELEQEEVLEDKGVAPAGTICDCPLRNLVGKMSAALGAPSASVGDLVLQFADSEEFADFVWRVKKTKQHTSHLKRCKQCLEIVFNN